MNKRILYPLFILSSIYTHNHYVSAQEWIIECVDCPKQFSDLTDRSLRLDQAGLPRVVYGEDHLYYARFDGESWHYETADGSSKVGRYASLVLDTAGNPHVSYYDEINRTLKYAFKNNMSWYIQVVDSDYGSGTHTCIDIDSFGLIHIAYVDSNNNAELRYAYQDGAEWHIERVDIGGTNGEPSPNSPMTTKISADVGYFASLILDASDNPHIGYYDKTNRAMKYAFRTETGWRTEFVDFEDWCGGGSSIDVDSLGIPYMSYESEFGLNFAYRDTVGWHILNIDNYFPAGSTSIQIDATGNPHICYNGDGNPRYARRDDTGWHLEIINCNDSYSGTSIAVDNTGYPRVLCTGWKTLGFAIRDDTGWHTERIETEETAGGSNRLALDGRGFPHIGYTSQVEHWPGSGLKYAFLDQAGWHVDIIDTLGDICCLSLLTLDSDDYPSITYKDRNGHTLKRAHRNNSRWQIQTIFDEDTSGWSSICVDSRGRNHIAYMHYDDLDLKYAHGDHSDWSVETISSAYVGAISKIILDGEGHPHICYCTPSGITYAHRTDSGWHTEVLGTAEGVWDVALTLDRSGSPHIIYNDIIEDRPGYAYKDFSGWHVYTIAMDESIIRYCFSLSFDGEGILHLAYADEVDDGLFYAYLDDSGWHSQGVDRTCQTGLASLALDGNGNPNISYYDKTNDDLKYAYIQRSPSAPPSPGSLHLLEVFPNPASSDVTIIYRVGAGSCFSNRRISLKVFDIQGRLMQSLSNHMPSWGTYTARWNVATVGRESIPSGIYVITLRADNPHETARELLIITK